MTCSELAALIVEHRPETPSLGYPAWVRRRVGRYVAEQRGNGAGYRELAEQLGVTRTTLAQWSKLGAEGAQGGFSEVILASKAAPPRRAEAVAEGSTALEVVSPQGFTVRGVTFEQALHALAVLR